MSFTNMLEEDILQYVFNTNNTDLNGYATSVYIGLISNLTNAETGSPTEIQAVGTYAYARVAKSRADATKFTVSVGTVTNADAVTFPTPSGGDWGIAIGFGLWDAASAGNLLAYGSLLYAKTINEGDAAPVFLTGALSFTLD